MRFILQYPEASGSGIDLFDAGAIPEIAAAAEAAGLDGIALTEHPAPSSRWLETGGHQSLDPFVALAAAAGVTERLALVTNLSVIPYRNPLLLAKSAATLNRMSEGRFYLGAGAGYLKSEYFALGVDFKERNALFEEALQVMQLHWSGEPFDIRGSPLLRSRHPGAASTSRSLGPDLDGRELRCCAATRRHVRGRVDADDRACFGGEDGPDASGHDDRRAAGTTRGVEEFAGDRYEELELIMGYSGPRLSRFDEEIEPARDRLGELEEARCRLGLRRPPMVAGARAEGMAGGLRGDLHKELGVARPNWQSRSEGASAGVDAPAHVPQIEVERQGAQRSGREGIRDAQHPAVQREDLLFAPTPSESELLSEGRREEAGGDGAVGPPKKLRHGPG